MRHVAIRSCTREKFAVAPLNEDVQHSLFERWVGSVTMRFPTAIAHVELDASANRIAAIYPNCRITEIRSRLAIPSAELDNIDFVTGKTDKMFAEITCEPARLQLQLIWNA